MALSMWACVMSSRARAPAIAAMRDENRHRERGRGTVAAVEHRLVALVERQRPDAVRHCSHENIVRTTNQTLAGRSASRRMYQGNQ